MISKRLIMLNIKKNQITYCTYIENKIYVGKKISNGIDLHLPISIICRYRINLIVCGSAVNLQNFKMLKSKEAEAELFEQKYFTNKTTFYDEYSLDCLFALLSYLNLKKYFMFEISLVFLETNKSSEIAFLGNIPVHLLDESKVLFIDEQAVFDLNIIDEKKPKKNICFFKESTSLFDTINYCKTIFGQNTLKDWILNPLNKISEIQERQRLVSEAGKIKNLDMLLKKCKYPYAENVIDQFKAVEFFKNSVSLIEKLKCTNLKYEDSYNTYIDLLSKIDIFDGDGIRYGLIPFYDELPRYLTKIAKILAYEEMQTLSVVFFPQIGYLIEISLNDKNSIFNNDKSNRSIFLTDSPTNNSLFLNYEEDLKKLHPNFHSNISTLDKNMSKHLIYNNDKFSSTNKNYSKEKTKLNSFLDKFENSKLSCSFKMKELDKNCSVPKILKTKNLHDQKIDLSFRLEKTKEIFESIDTENLSHSKNPLSLSCKNNFSFVCNEKMYIKNDDMRYLDEEIGDLNNLLQEYKSIIMGEIRLLIQKTNMQPLFSYIGKIDALFSLYTFAKNYKCTTPVFNTNNKIVIQNFFGKNLNVLIKKNSILRCSTYLLVSIGRAIILAQMGSFVPSKVVSIPIFRKLYTSIHPRESLIQSKSYFKSSILNINKMLSIEMKDAIFLLDELGYGTNYTEGLSIFYGVHKVIYNAYVLSSTTYKEILEIEHSCVKTKKTPRHNSSLMTNKALSQTLVIGEKRDDFSKKANKSTIFESRDKKYLFKNDKLSHKINTTLPQFSSSQINEKEKVKYCLRCFYEIICFNEQDSNRVGEISKINLEPCIKEKFLEVFNSIEIRSPKKDKIKVEWAVHIINQFIRDNKL